MVDEVEVPEEASEPAGMFNSGPPESPLARHPLSWEPLDLCRAPPPNPEPFATVISGLASEMLEHDAKRFNVEGTNP